MPTRLCLVLCLLLVGCDDDPPPRPPQLRLVVIPATVTADVGSTLVLEVLTDCITPMDGYERTFVEAGGAGVAFLGFPGEADVSGDPQTNDLSVIARCDAAALDDCLAWNFRGGDSVRTFCNEEITQELTFTCNSMGSGTIQFRALTTGDGRIRESATVNVSIGCGAAPPSEFPDGDYPTSASFSGGMGGCGAPASFVDDLDIAVEAAQITLTQPSTGDVNTGSIGPSGVFSAMRADGLESYMGMLSPDGTGTAVNMYTADGCTSTWDVVFSVR